MADEAPSNSARAAIDLAIERAQEADKTLAALSEMLKTGTAMFRFEPISAKQMFKVPLRVRIKRTSWYVFDRVVIPTVTTAAAILSAIAVAGAMRM